MTDWRPIETAPTDGTHIDVWSDGDRITDVWWCDGTWNRPDFTYGDVPIRDAVTHWMPIPEPPQ